MSQDYESKIKKLKDLARELPKESGVYLMKDAIGKVIYVGKAKNLRKRVKDYFFGRDERYQIKFLLKRIETFETIITDNEEQALLLERDLISKFKPKYNIRLKDDKNYLSIKIDTSEKWPRPQLVRRVEQDGARYYGPYTSGNQARDLLNIINETVPLRSCNDTVFNNRVRPCLEYQIKRCIAPCCLDIDENEYGQLVKQAQSILSGKTDEIVKQLEVQMQQASDNLDFELAAVNRDRITALGRFKDAQKFMSAGAENRDIFALYRDESLATLSVMEVRNGRVADNRNYHFEELALSNSEIIQSAIEQYYAADRLVPEELVLSDAPENQQLLGSYLKKIAGSKVTLTVPERGLKFRLVKLAALNAEKHFDLKFNAEDKLQKILKKLTKLCKLKQVPRRIECIDISNLQGSDIVGAVVSFYDGRPDKSRYKKFKISFQDKPDDFLAIYEVVKRHLSAGMRDAEFPDLLIIDGGKIQLKFALKAIEELKIEQEVIALAKARSKTAKKKAVPERIFIPESLDGEGGAIKLPAGEPLTQLVASIRDEVHRFVIGFHRARRDKRVFSSVLDEIPGLGAIRQKNLLKTFGSVEGIAKATLEDLKSNKIPENIARAILERLNPN